MRARKDVASVATRRAAFSPLLEPLPLLLCRLCRERLPRPSSASHHISPAHASAADATGGATVFAAVAGA